MTARFSEEDDAMIRNETHDGKIRRIVLASLGLLCVGLAVLGAILPGLPTTVFLIAASYLFARSSPALDRRLHQNRWLGPYLRRFAETRGMPRKAKAAALASMWLGIGFSCWALSGVSLAVQVATVACGLVGSGTLLLWVRTVPARAPVSGGALRAAGHGARRIER
jgi:uncharacterized membrane protein YbaN (DUF454 family)